MKGVALVFGFLALVAATRLVWNHRYEPQEGRAAVAVGEGAGGGFSVVKKPGDKPFAKVCGLPFGGPVGGLHLRLAFRSVDLEPDGEKWKDGRLILEWMDAAGRVVARDVVLTLQGSDARTHRAERIVRAAEAGLVPQLRVEHLGVSGRMEIHSFRAVVVRERGWVKWAAVGLLVMWGFWCYGFVSACSNVSKMRVAGVALLLVVMGWFFVVPGPWGHQSPLLGEFQTGGEPAEFVTAAGPVSDASARDVEPMGEMSSQGSWLERVKKALSFLRPVLHVLFFMAVAFSIARLCGARCAWWCGLLVSCAVELGQIGFGFGFDWVDVSDLVVNALGIAAAVRVAEMRFGGGRGMRVPGSVSGEKGSGISECERSPEDDTQDTREKQTSGPFRGEGSLGNG